MPAVVKRWSEEGVRVFAGYCEYGPHLDKRPTLKALLSCTGGMVKLLFLNALFEIPTSM